MMMLFALAGFGLLLSAYRYGTWLGTSSAIICMAVIIQYSPLMQKFWYSVFISDFGTEPDATQVG